MSFDEDIDALSEKLTRKELEEISVKKKR